MKSSNQPQTSPAQDTIAIPRDLYFSVMDALCRLGKFAGHAYTIAENLKAAENNGGKGAWRNIVMLADLAEEADGVCGEKLADTICLEAEKQGK
ncbi:Uncharacterised protein [Kingella potus]|uniref:Uncharacterized protein n=1 Tax=Kingella potus TaxID=265175 RepID=A0A377R4A4_9NEIS|nr:hypothetical protein [Kingella potus]UOO99845.1 hypothetical protein LVJ84_07045 [Kingella potus]STR03099.1 Uncharacterised protein [Kingella potus]